MVDGASELSPVERGLKAVGAAGAVAFLLVFFAASLDGGFDARVFLLSGTALVLAWARNWFLVPLHLRNADAERREWSRYLETDWRFVDAVSDLTGDELDQMRDVFERGDDRGARDLVSRRFPSFDAKETQAFIVFFNDMFTRHVSAYLDADGRLQPFDEGR